MHAGNHERSDGDATHRYLNSTWGEAYANPLINSTSTSTSPLGHVLTKGSFLGAGLHGTTPSGTSAYFSVDVGSVHIFALSTQNPTGAELDWLMADLAAATQPEQRKLVPWVMGTSHYPIYNPSVAKHENCSAAAYVSIEGELADPNAAFLTCEESGEGEGCRTVGDLTAEAAATMNQIFFRFGVDIWNAGHSHEYGVTWPMQNGSSTQMSYVDPGQATVYITEGNGGVLGCPSTQTFNSNITVPWGRE